ncbi:MAG: hypothetical protein RRA63_00510 [Candidatus Calescibacterium sp.]|nr:hypothetical protein [Candidatus Calescibacterium sp.]
MHKPNRIFFDFGFTNDFWADSAGIIIAANVGIDIRYTFQHTEGGDKITGIAQVKKVGFNNYVTSCVQFASFVTAATSPIIPIPECDIPAGAGSCPPPPYRSVDTCTIVNGGSSQYVFKTELLPTAPAPSTLGEGRYAYSITNYYVGIGIHHNLISRFLYEFIGDGLMCLWADRKSRFCISSLENTDKFAFFMPQLKDRYPGKEMALEIIPIYKDPGNPSGNTGGAASYNRPLSVVAYAKTGGPTFRPVLSVYSQNSTRVNFWNEFMSNATYGSSFTMFVQPTTWFDTADLMIEIPYVDFSFNVITTGTITDPVASQTWMRVFGLTVGIRVSLDLDIVPCVFPDCGMTVEFPGPDTIDFSKPLTSYYRDYYGNPVDPTQGGNYFPEGGTFARVIDLTMYVDPDVRYFIAYNTNALGLSGSDWEGILANILPILLNEVLGIKCRLAFDPAALLQGVDILALAGFAEDKYARWVGSQLRSLKLPIEINFPWVGPEFGSTLAWDQPFAGNPKDNVGDYFEIFIHWRGRAPRIVSQLMAAAMLPLLKCGNDICESDEDNNTCPTDCYCGNNTCDKGESTSSCPADCFCGNGTCDPGESSASCPADCPSGGGGGGGGGSGDDLYDIPQCGGGGPSLPPICPLLMGFSPKAVNLHSGSGKSKNGFRVTPPETFITYTSDPHALYTKIEFAAWSPHSSRFRYSWRLDGGTWNLWQRENSVVLHHLLEGWHVFEVRAQDENKLIDPTPARYTFRIDSLGPDIKLTAPEMVRGSKFKAFIDVQDAQAQKSETLVSWKLNDGEWSEWVPASELTSIEINSLAKGEHILHIRAKDDVGNISTYSHRFFVSEKPRVLGCSSTAGVSFGFLLIFIIFISLRFSFSTIAKRK